MLNVDDVGVEEGDLEYLQPVPRALADGSLRAFACPG
jgi:hypothetical protein